MNQFESILCQTKGLLNQPFSSFQAEKLWHYYQLVLKWNRRLHLTTIVQPPDFIKRHINESVLTASYIKNSVNNLWDIGSGLGVPGLIIAIMRPDLAVHLVESSVKKSTFLQQVLDELALQNATVICSRFQSLDALPIASCLTVRAIEGMNRNLKAIVKLGENAEQLIVLGGEDLAGLLCEIIKNEERPLWNLETLLIADSYRRYLFNLNRST